MGTASTHLYSLTWLLRFIHLPIASDCCPKKWWDFNLCTGVLSYQFPKLGCVTANGRWRLVKQIWLLPSCPHVSIVLLFHKHNSLPLGQTRAYISVYKRVQCLNYLCNLKALTGMTLLVKWSLSEPEDWVRIPPSDNLTGNLITLNCCQDKKEEKETGNYPFLAQIVLSGILSENLITYGFITLIPDLLTTAPIHPLNEQLFQTNLGQIWRGSSKQQKADS